MRKIAVLLIAGVAVMYAQEKLRVIAFGAHPDDCDSRVGGTG